MSIELVRAVNISKIEKEIYDRKIPFLVTDKKSCKKMPPMK